MISFDYLSFGAGVQTTALLFLYKEKKINFKKAIFADTGAEKESTYELLNKLKSIFPNLIIECSNGNIIEDTLREKYISAPVFSDIGSKGRRSCTSRYKIFPVAREIRKIENLRFKRLPKESISLGLGFSTDEIGRCKPNQLKWLKNIFPLIELNLSRKDCVDICKKHGINPPRSACYFCPLQNNKDWNEIKKTPDWKKAVDFDYKIRHLKKDRLNYIYRSNIPLDKAEFDDNQYNLFALNDCESGFCGT